MPKRTAVTHADLAPRPRSTDLGSKTGAILIVLTILCGLFCFILCLTAEATRSQETRVNTSGGGNEERYECSYSGSGKTPLLCAAIAFVGLAVGMVVEHLYMLIAISKAPPCAVIAWDPHSALAKTLTWQAGFFFITTWICFGVGEILLLIGLSVESGHLKNWQRPRPSCLVIKEGLFTASGVFSLLTVFLAAGLYLTALRALRIFEAQESVRREVLEASTHYAAASPPTSPLPATIAREDPVIREIRNQPPTFSFTKHSIPA